MTLEVEGNFQVMQNKPFQKLSLCLALRRTVSAWKERHQTPTNQGQFP